MKHPKASPVWIVPGVLLLMAAALRFVWADCCSVSACDCADASAWICTLLVEQNCNTTWTNGTPGLPCNNDFYGGGAASALTICDDPNATTVCNGASWTFGGGETNIQADPVGFVCNGKTNQWHFHDPKKPACSRLRQRLRALARTPPPKP